jgi:Domain of unknown function (DUF4320)
MVHLLKSKHGEGYTDVIVIILSAMLVIALAVKVFPVFIVKHQLDNFANELCRTAEIAGCIASETTARAQELKEHTGLNPQITWTASYISGTSRVQLNGSMTVTLKQTENIGLFGSFGSFPIELTAKATGRSEVYWK